ncbi:MAG TPA: hypothetical protein VLH56_11380 [Dissulfurispiraceae bacterium]|nr:hypothetical protein [Dissulfurispiraceae bacterium]
MPSLKIWNADTGEWNYIGKGGGGGDVVGPSSAVDGNIAVFDLTTGKLVKDFGYPPWSLTVMASDYVCDGTDLEDVTGLSFSVVSGGMYRFEFVLPWKSTNGLYGMGWAISAPNLDFGQFWCFKASGSGTVNGNTTAVQHFNPATVDSGCFYTTSRQETGGDYENKGEGDVLHMFGMIKPSANGIVQARIRAESASYPVTVLAGAHVEWRKLT